MSLPNLLAVARGDRPADLLLRNGRIVNVFSGEIENGAIAIVDGTIAGISTEPSAESGNDYHATQSVDLQRAFVTPGLIDAHVHIESSLCTPPGFAQAVLPRGVTCAVVDPHEIANVTGAEGIRYLYEISRQLPLRVIVMAPACVPATDMAHSGASLSADDLAPLIAQGVVHGLGEVMNFPGVIAGDTGLLSKIVEFRGCPIDGHAPSLTGNALNAYVASGIGSEHECTTVAEAAGKLARGLYILIREATNAHNLHNLLPLITSHNARRICFCTDDRVPSDLLQQGSIDYMVREAIAFGIEPIEAIRMATLNSAEWFGLHDRGALAPGRVADFLIVDDLNDFQPQQVYVGGRLVAEKGALIADLEPESNIAIENFRNRIDIDWPAVHLTIPARSQRIRVIGVIEHQLVTEERIMDATIQQDQVVADPERDLLKIAVIERHHGRGSMGIGFIQGIGLKRGAMAGTVAHDHHNLIVIGVDDESMMTAAHAVAEMGGGLVVADGEHIAASLPLPVAGLMSDHPIAQVRTAYDTLLATAKRFGSPLHDPFMAMSFMALEVIPKLKLTDRGLVDVEQFTFVDLFV